MVLTLPIPEKLLGQGCVIQISKFTCLKVGFAKGFQHLPRVTVGVSWIGKQHFQNFQKQSRHWEGWKLQLLKKRKFYSYYTSNKNHTEWVLSGRYTVFARVVHNSRSPQTPFAAQRQVLGPQGLVKFQQTQWYGVRRWGYLAQDTCNLILWKIAPSNWRTNKESSSFDGIFWGYPFFMEEKGRDFIVVMYRKVCFLFYASGNCCLCQYVGL